MPISVICPGCHARFQVSEKFGGRQGPCPKCKSIINIPKESEQVKIAEPEDYGGTKDTKGKLVLKPIEREEAKFNTNAAIAIGAGCLVTLGLAWIIGRSPPISWLVLAGGAALLAPPLVLAGYSFLRDGELEPYRGAALWIRTLICSAVYAALWGAYAFLSAKGYLNGAQAWVFAGPPIVALGAGASYVTLDLEFGSAVFHYAFYLGATVVLRLVMGLPAV